MRRLLAGMMLIGLLWLPVVVAEPARPTKPVLAPFEAEYALFKDDIEVGIAERRLVALPEGRWRYESLAHATGFIALLVPDHIRETSTFRLHRRQLRPLEYRYDKTGGSEEEHYDVVFDWRGDETRYAHNGETFPLPGDAADLLGFQIDLMLRLRRGRKYVNFTLALKDGLQEYAFRRKGRETWPLSDGTLELLRIEQIPNERPERFTLWVAPSLDYLPVRIERRKNGKLTAFELRRYNGRLIERAEDEEEEEEP